VPYGGRQEAGFEPKYKAACQVSHGAFNGLHASARRGSNPPTFNAVYLRQQPDQPGIVIHKAQDAPGLNNALGLFNEVPNGLLGALMNHKVVNDHVAAAVWEARALP
jgi:hypothetical protein